MILVASSLRAQESGPVPERVLVVANQNDPASLEIAFHYLERRGIPSDNLIQVQCPKAHDIDWEVYVRDIHNPLKRKLIQRGFMTGRLTDETDEHGRVVAEYAGHDLDFLVTCRLPVRIRGSGDSPDKSTAAAVDSELALLPQNRLPRAGPLRNPLFGKRVATPQALSSVIRVNRLDGPTVADAKALVDHALEAERKGLIGRAYIDLSGRSPEGDEWLEETAKRIEELHYPLMVHRPRSALSADQRMDGLAIYFGWYERRPYPDFERLKAFQTGAIGFHIHSFSASQLRSTQEWTGFFIARGAAATVGNVFEPYLALSHHPQVIMKALLSGMTAGEAMWAGLPSTSWMAVNIGDPLYRPFAVDLDAQLAAVEAGELTSRDSSYVIARAMEREESPAAAWALGRKWFRRRPTPVLAAAIGDYLNDHVADTIASLAAAFPEGKAIAQADIDPAWHATQLLAANGAKEEAARIVEALYFESELDGVKAEVMLEAAIQIAQEGGREVVAELLRSRLAARTD